MQSKAHGRNLALLGMIAALALAGCALDERALPGEEELAEGVETTAATSEISVLVNYTVSVIKTGSGGGGVTSSPGYISCSPTCTASVPAGTVLTLTATPAVSATFGGWSGGGCSGTGTCTITVSGDVTIGANFQQIFNTLTVTKAGLGSGTVTSSPGGINCGSTCSTSAPYNTTFALTATPSAGSLFLGWSGSGCSGTGSCVVSMTAARAVTATFVQANPIVSVIKTGSGGGGVTSSPSYINCSPTCSAAVPYGTLLTLTATPHISSIFGGWSGGGCSGTGTCTIAVGADVTIGANFQTKFFTLSVTKAGFGVGTVTSSPSGINCGSACSTSAPYGTNISLTATPSGTSTFVGWSGACSGTGSCIVSMTAARAVTATFNP